MQKKNMKKSRHKYQLDKFEQLRLKWRLIYRLVTENMIDLTRLQLMKIKHPGEFVHIAGSAKSKKKSFFFALTNK